MYFFYIHATDSTQNHSKSISSLHYSDVPFWTQSGHQTHGRGQRGRKWDSPQGNLFLTGCFFKPEKASPSRLSIAMGVSLLKILQSFLPKEQVELKWPNDILLNQKKCAGILIEIDEFFYIGIGINIASHPDNTPMPASHLQTYEYIDKNALIMKIIKTIPNFKELENFEHIQQIWWSLAKNSISFWNLREPIQGDILGIDEQGHLLIQLKSGDVIKRHHPFNE